MIISLEEEEQEELQDVAQNVVTLDGEVMAVNGRILAGHQVGPAVAPFDPAVYAQGGSKRFRKQPDVASVCSCTCYGVSESKTASRTRKHSQRGRRKRGLRVQIRRFFRRLLGLTGQGSDASDSADGNFYDEETQSISNCHRFAVKRASM